MPSLTKDVRSFLIREARKLHKRGESDEIEFVLGTATENEEEMLRVRVITVQNTLSYDVFGANYRFYNLPVTIAKEQAQVDVMVIIPEVKNSYKITESLTKVNAIRAYKGSSKANFVKKVPKAIVDLWNS